MSGLRYAGYIRISSEDQVGNYSLDAQRRLIERYARAWHGELVEIYDDSIVSGSSADRPQLRRMLYDAHLGKFDTLIVHKFDRLNRNRLDALALKSMLRYDCGIKVLSISEPSEDTHGEEGMYIEGLLESVAEWYLENLGEEMAKGKHERARQGLHNNQAPFGMRKDERKVLVKDENEYPGLLLAFEAFATGEFSYGAIADLLNKGNYRTKKNARFSPDTIREMLSNRTYLGYVKYQRYQENPDGSRSYSGGIEWISGQHTGILDEELFERCQRVRTSPSTSPSTPIPQLLSGLVFCYRCCNRPMPEGVNSERWGKMRSVNTNAYRCRAGDFSVECPQRYASADILNSQVLDVIRAMPLPHEWQTRIVPDLSLQIAAEYFGERLERIRQVIDEVGFSWDHGFISDKATYIQNRIRLRQNLLDSRPTPISSELGYELLRDFSSRLNACGSNITAMHQLLTLLIERVYVLDKTLAGIRFKGDYYLDLTK